MADGKDATENNENMVIGKLYKKGQINKAWKTRYFVGNRSMQNIRYYEKENQLKEEKNEKGEIDLNSIWRIEINASELEQELPKYIVSNRDLKSDKAHTFYLVSDRRTFVLAAQNKTQLMQWLNFLYLCLYDYKQIKSGYLNKKDPKQATFKLQYFVLNSSQQLRSYDDELLTNCLGVIDCKNITEINELAIIGYVFDIHLDLNIWTLAADNEHQRSQWTKTIDIMRNKDWKHRLSESQKANAPLTIYKRPKYDVGDDEKENEAAPKVNQETITSSKKEDNIVSKDTDDIHDNHESLKVNAGETHNDSKNAPEPNSLKKSTDSKSSESKNEY